MTVVRVQPVPLTLEDLTVMLRADEPNYGAATTVGPDAFPHLEALVRGADELLAERATAFASRTNDERAADLLRWATQSPSTRIRTQAAYGARYLLGNDAADVLTTLIGDADAGVRSVAIKSTTTVFDRGTVPPDIAAAVSRLTQDDPEAFIREMSRDARA